MIRDFLMGKGKKSIITRQEACQNQQIVSKINQSIYILKNIFPHKNTLFLYYNTIIILFVNEYKKFEVISK